MLDGDGHRLRMPIGDSTDIEQRRGQSRSFHDALVVQTRKQDAEILWVKAVLFDRRDEYILCHRALAGLLCTKTNCEEQPTRFADRFSRQQQWLEKVAGMPPRFPPI